MQSILMTQFFTSVFVRTSSLLLALYSTSMMRVLRVTATNQHLFPMNTSKSMIINFTHFQVMSAIPDTIHDTKGMTVLMMNADTASEGLRERTEHIDIFLFLPITQWCSISDVLFTGGR